MICKCEIEEDGYICAEMIIELEHSDEKCARCGHYAKCHRFERQIGSPPASPELLETKP